MVQLQLWYERCCTLPPVALIVIPHHIRVSESSSSRCVFTNKLRFARKLRLCIYYQVMFLLVFCVSHVGNKLLISFKAMCFSKPVSLLIGSVSEKVRALYIVLSVTSFRCVIHVSRLLCSYFCVPMFPFFPIRRNGSSTSGPYGHL